MQSLNVTYSILQLKLIASDGYSYNIKRKLPNSTHWQCTSRPKTNPCRATVKEKDNVFEPGPTAHNHPPKIGSVVATKISFKVKEKAMEDLFKPAAAIVDEVLLEQLGDVPCPALRKPINMAKSANYFRQSRRPKDPADLNFEIEEAHIPADFLRANVIVRDRIMALPFLPASKIPRVYRHLRPQAATAPLREFLAYVGDQWVYGSFFSPIDWSVYGQAVRTNNDIEGWHNRINRRANGKSQLPFYLLIGFFTRKHSSPPSMSDWFQKIN